MNAQRAALDAALLDAHTSGDARRLVVLYTDAADMAERGGDTNAACFYMTHAYVFALQSGAPDCDRLHKRLIAHGRDE